MKRSSILVIAAGLLALTACGREGAGVSPKGPAKPAEAQAGYLTPPRVTGGSVVGDAIVLSGRAMTGARVRLASPGGEVEFAEADADGLWRIDLPRSAQVRLYGLSMGVEGRQAQSQGYVMVSPQGRVAVLRAGAGAVVLGAGPSPKITALDFDAEGGAVVSGVGPAEAAVTVRADGRQMAEGRTDAAGGFSIAFNQPLAAGRRRIVAEGEAWQADAAFDVSEAAPVTGAAFRAAMQGDVIRVDWLTPGGGLQTTLIRP